MKVLGGHFRCALATHAGVRGNASTMVIARALARMYEREKPPSKKACNALLIELWNDPAIRSAATTARRKALRGERTKSHRRLESSTDFYESRAWRELRYQAIKLYGRRCMCCGATSGEIHVDHIKPRSKYPELALDIKNLQVLCRDCNIGKSNKDETDWRNTLGVDESGRIALA